MVGSLLCWPEIGAVYVRPKSASHVERPSAYLTSLPPSPVCLAGGVWPNSLVGTGACVRRDSPKTKMVVGISEFQSTRLREARPLIYNPMIPHPLFSEFCEPKWKQVGGSGEMAGKNKRVFVFSGLQYCERQRQCSVAWSSQSALIEDGCQCQNTSGPCKSREGLAPMCSIFDFQFCPR